MHDAFNGANGINGDFGDDVWLHFPDFFFIYARTFSRIHKDRLCSKTCGSKNSTRNFFEVEKDPDEKFGQRNLVREWRILPQKELWVGSIATWVKVNWQTSPPPTRTTTPTVLRPDGFAAGNNASWWQLDFFPFVRCIFSGQDESIHDLHWWHNFPYILG